ncbi:hypothetical protein F2Q68_00008638 [Brassica cretica]|uniref:peroxidase n=1 Tax=Brassica cretica TaxID=69181 RepID=A0A3N6S716_BRACR|nr:hypothetical protein F2Q68_00008638 [Brassica cretica]
MTTLAGKPKEAPESWVSYSVFRGRYALLRQTRGVVARYANNNAFFKRQFVRAMIKMGAVDVLTGRAGEIRRNCRRFN